MDYLKEHAVGFAIAGANTIIMGLVVWYLIRLFNSRKPDTNLSGWNVRGDWAAVPGLMAALAAAKLYVAREKFGPYKNDDPFDVIIVIMPKPWPSPNGGHYRGIANGLEQIYFKKQRVVYVANLNSRPAHETALAEELSHWLKWCAQNDWGQVALRQNSPDVDEANAELTALMASKIPSIG